MKNVRLIVCVALLVFALAANTLGKTGTISTTKIGTISTTRTGTISTTVSGTSRTGTISTTRTGTISTTTFDLRVNRFSLVELLLEALRSWW